MANIKISELTALTPPDAADLVPVTDSSASQTKRTTVGEIVGIINGDVDVANDGTATISELPVSKLQDGSARQLLQTDAAGTGVEWTSNVDVPGTLDVTGATTLDSTLGVTGQSTLASAAVSDLTSGRVVLAGTGGELEDSAGLTFNGTQLDVDGNVVITGDLTVEGASTILETETVKVEDKNIELGVVASPTDVTADGGGITLKGDTDKTINWVDATDAWTSSERFSVPLGAEAVPSLTFTGDPNTGLYSPGADQVAISTNGTQRVNFGTGQVVFNETGENYDFRIEGDTEPNLVFVDASTNRVGLGTSNPQSIIDISQVNGGDVYITNPTNYGTTPGANPTSRVSNGISWRGNIVTGFGSNATISETNFIRSVLEDTSTGNSNVQGRYALTFGTAPGGSSSGIATERVRIDYLGRVGIGPNGAGGYDVLFNPGSSSSPLVRDSSGRLLVGTSTTSQQLSLLVQGSSGGGTSGVVRVSNTGATPSSGSALGSFDFSDNGHTPAARIIARRDGGTWTSGSSQPTRLEFSTTADGASSPTERMRITSDAYVRLASGTGGIQFNGDTAAANALDDYEEGTWTPVIVGVTTTGTGTYSTQVGRYTKVGRQVYCTGALIWTAHDGTGNMRIEGLPFNALSVTELLNAAVFAYVSNITMPADSVLMGDMQNTTSRINLRSVAVGGGTPATLTMDSAGNIYFSITYQTN